MLVSYLAPQSMINRIVNQLTPGRADESEKKLLKSRNGAACIEVNNRTSDPVVDVAFRYATIKHTTIGAGDRVLSASNCSNL